MKPKLTLDALRNEAREFARMESKHQEPTLFGVTDGKAVGTYFEHKFQLDFCKMAGWAYLLKLLRLAAGASIINSGKAVFP